MIDIEELKSLIIERLKPLKPYKVVLFGSYAYGVPNENSDVDLYVVTNDEFMPQNWREKSNVYLKIASVLDDIMRKHPTDLIVHTKAMHRKFLDSNSYFSKIITTKGVLL